ncbi:MAG TPA: hypothetical protein VEN81_08165 [Planctomycetota bacterium]|jgi:hypothetical protein|nr:hypothetical protein [Planctomycetota bacterium]
MDPLTLDWGGATAEFQNEEARSAVHMFAHDLTTPERAQRALRYAQARVAWCGKKMPGFTQEIWFDEREQAVAPGAKDRIREALKGQTSALMFMSEGGE